MVPLGDPRKVAEPFEIACPEPGTGRWVDSRNWVYDFARDLPAGVRCTFRIKPGLTTLAETLIVGQQEFAFSTGGAGHPTSFSHVPMSMKAAEVGTDRGGDNDPLSYGPNRPHATS